jgi:hypothetical protein
MNRSWRRSILSVALTLTVVVSAIQFASSSALAAGKQTLTGEIGDAMCGVKHMEGEGTPAQCTRTCVSHGSKYALVLGDKIYVLNTGDKTALAVLEQQAGKKATVTGTVDGTNVDVSKVVAAK